MMEMWWAVELYRDVLFHAEYGTMIHSGAVHRHAGRRGQGRR